MKRILFPTDFSPIAINAFQYAIQLAIDLDATIDLVHIYTIDYTEGQYYAPSHIREVSTAKENWALDQLSIFCKDAPSTVMGEKHAIQGIFVDREIIDLSYDGYYDLIVMGINRSEGILNRLLGNTATRIMTEAACPILALPEKIKYSFIKSITYATVFDPSDLPIVEQLIQFAGKLDASVEFLHVNDQKDGRSTTDYRKIKGIPNQYVAFLERKDVSVETGVAAHLSKSQVDILALYIPRRKAWERLFHTSFTKKMVFQTDTPLLIFHQ